MEEVEGVVSFLYVDHLDHFAPLIGVHDVSISLVVLFIRGIGTRVLLGEVEEFAVLHGDEALVELLVRLGQFDHIEVAYLCKLGLRFLGRLHREKAHC